MLAVIGIAFAPAITALVAQGFDGPRRELTTVLVRILFPMTGLMVVSAWCLGILNTHRRFFLPYAAPALWNIAGVAAMVAGAAWLKGEGLYGLSLRSPGEPSRAAFSRLRSSCRPAGVCCRGFHCA